MPVQVSYPGVYVQEVASGSRTISGVATSIPLFIGMADQGPMDTATRVQGYADFQRKFGAANLKGELHDQVKQFFQNGGSTAWVMRIASGAAPAKVELKNEAQQATLELEARSYGLVGAMIRATVDYDTPDPEATFNLKVEQMGTGPGGTLVVVASESYSGLDMTPGSGKYVVDVLEQNSDLVRATDLGGAPAIAAAYSLWGVWETAAGFTTALEDAFPSTTGSFRISVDGSPFVTVTLDGAVIHDNLAALNTTINGFLNAVGKSITATQVAVGTRQLWKITSGGTGGLIRFAPSGAADDICAAMQMGSAYGGVDVGGSAPRRPMINGLSGVLRADDATALATNLGRLLDLDIADRITGFTVTDVQGPDATTVALAVPSANPTSLKDIRTVLDELVAGINAQLDRWVAKRVGLRVVLTPNFGGPSTDFTAYAATGGDLTLNTTYFWANGTGNVRNYQLGGFSTNQGEFQNGNAPGFDGTTPGIDNYDDAYTIAKRDIDIFNMLILPVADGQGDGERAVLWGPASVFAKSERAILIMDPPGAWATADDVVDPTTGVASLRAGVVTDHTALYWPRIQVAGDSGLKTIDPAGAMAGIMARTDGARGVWKAPAGLEANLYGVRGVAHGMSDGENGLINPQAVNAIRAFPNGIVSWGARTMVGFDNSGDDDYKYLPVRRFALFIQESLYRGLQWAVFEPNDEPLWRQMATTAGAFMNTLFRQGAFAGKKSSDAYFIKVDRETTTQTDINLGIVNVVIGFAPLKPAEFVVITLQQKAGEVQV